MAGREDERIPEQRTQGNPVNEAPEEKSRRVQIDDQERSANYMQEFGEGQIQFASPAKPEKADERASVFSDVEKSAARLIASADKLAKNAQDLGSQIKALASKTHDIANDKPRNDGSAILDRLTSFDQTLVEAGEASLALRNLVENNLSDLRRASQSDSPVNDQQKSTGRAESVDDLDIMAEESTMDGSSAVLMHQERRSTMKSVDTKSARATLVGAPLPPIEPSNSEQATSSERQSTQSLSSGKERTSKAGSSSGVDIK